eukprot:GSA25T00022793001.1
MIEKNDGQDAKNHVHEIQTRHAASTSARTLSLSSLQYVVGEEDTRTKVSAGSA